MRTRQELAPGNRRRSSWWVGAALTTVLCTVGGVRSAEAVVELRDLVFTPSVVSVLPGASATFQITGVFSDGSSADFTGKVDLFSSDARVAAAQPDGSFLALRAGRTRISAVDPVTNRESRVAAEINVPELDLISIEPATSSLLVGGQVGLRAFGSYSDGTTGIDLTRQVTWTSSRPLVAAVLVAADGTVTLTGLARGDAQIVATEPVSELRSNSSTGRVSVELAPTSGGGGTVGPKITSMEVSPTAVTLRIGETTEVQALAVFDDGRTGVDVTSQVDWSSMKSSVARVQKDPAGVAQAVAVAGGTATIQAKDRVSGVRSAKTTGVITVDRGPQPEEITVTPVASTILRDQQVGMRAYATYSDVPEPVEVTATAIWSSSDGGVARVQKAADGSVSILGLKPGTATIVARDSGWGVKSDTATGRVTVIGEPRITSLKVVPATAAIRVGNTQGLKALASWDDGRVDVDVTGIVSWSTTKETTAAVETDDVTGLPRVVGVAPGEVTIYATGPDGKIRSPKTTGKMVIVGTLSSVLVSPDKKVLRLGEESRLKAVGTFERSAVADISPGVDWISVDPAIATIDEKGRAKGLAYGSTTAIAIDRATGISSHASAGDGQIVVVGDPTSLRVTPSPLILAMGATGDLKAQAAFPGQSELLNVSSKVNWFSADSSSVAVDAAGKATCLRQGTVVVSARDPATGLGSTETGGDATVLCGVPVVGVDVEPGALLLGLDRTKRLKAYVRYANGTRVEITKKATWSTSNDKVVLVSNTDGERGLVLGIDGGEATIHATDPASGVSSTAGGSHGSVVTVPGYPIGIQIQPRPTSGGFVVGQPGLTKQMKVLARFYGGATRGLNAEVTWSTGNGAVATVANGETSELKPGLVSFRSRGTTTLTISWPKKGVPLPAGALPLTDTVPLKAE